MSKRKKRRKEGGVLMLLDEAFLEGLTPLEAALLHSTVTTVRGDLLLMGLTVSTLSFLKNIL